MADTQEAKIYSFWLDILFIMSLSSILVYVHHRNSYIKIQKIKNKGLHSVRKYAKIDKQFV